MSKPVKVINIIFRIMIFATFLIAAAALGTFMLFSVQVADNTYNIYSAPDSVLEMIVLCGNLYLVMTIAALVSAVFSWVAFKTTSVGMAIGRGIAMALTAGYNFIFLRTMMMVRDVMSYYMGSLSYEDVMKYEGAYAGYTSDEFAGQILLAVSAMALTGFVFFILSITSIVALAKKPVRVNPQVAYNPYGQGNGMYNNNMNNMNNPYNNQMPNNMYNGQPNMYNNMNPPYNGQPSGMYSGNMGNTYGQPVNMQQPNNIQGMQPMGSQPYEAAQQTAATQETSGDLRAENQQITGYDPYTGAPIYGDANKSNQ